MDCPAPKIRPAFAVFTDSLCEGLIPAWHDNRGLPVTYATKREAQIEITETLMEQLRQFLAGERDFDDAINTDDFILPVSVWPDGTIQLDDGRRFGKQQT